MLTYSAKLEMSGTAARLKTWLPLMILKQIMDALDECQNSIVSYRIVWPGMNIIRLLTLFYNLQASYFVAAKITS